VARGKVKWFNATKGFGFIQPESGGNDVFVHISAVQRAGFHSLNSEQPIEYELETRSDGKPTAKILNVQVHRWNEHVTTGKVKWYDPTKGYGFILPDDGGRDVFVHISAVEAAGLSTLIDGQAIQFEVGPGRNGRQAAENLRLL